MIGQYKGLIAENVAPKDVNTISIYDSNNVKKASMAVPDFMKYPSGTPLYSFGVLADIHLATTDAISDFDYALTWLKSKGASMACIAGDLTTIGFYYNRGDTEVYTAQFQNYLNAKNTHESDSFKLYCIAGNHESYNKDITEDAALYKQYTGCDLYFSLMHGNDVFLFVSQPTGTRMFNSEELTWLQGQLNTYADKRCFLFVHPYVGGSGDTLQTHSLGLGGGGGDIFGYSTEADRTAFLTALQNHGNVTVFHGHSHFKFECQNHDKSTNYSNEYGFHSVHVPSGAIPRIITYTNGQPQMTGVDSGSQFYYVEVFGNCIVLSGVDIGLENGTRSAKLIPQGIIKVTT